MEIPPKDWQIAAPRERAIPQDARCARCGGDQDLRLYVRLDEDYQREDIFQNEVVYCVGCLQRR